MVKTIRAKFRNGAIVPVSPLDIDINGGEDLIVTIDIPRPAQERLKRMSSDGRNKYWEEFKQMIYEERSRGIPDWTTPSAAYSPASAAGYALPETSSATSPS